MDGISGKGVPINSEETALIDRLFDPAAIAVIAERGRGPTLRDTRRSIFMVVGDGI